MNYVRTLRVRFALWTAGFLLAALTLFGLFVYFNMSYSLATPVDETLHLTAMQLLAEIDTRAGHLVVVENPIEETEYTQLREQGLSMRVLDLAGQPVNEFGPYTALPSPQLTPRNATRPGAYVTLTDPASQTPIRVYSMLIVDENQAPVGTLQVAQSLANLRRTLNLLFITLLIGGPLIVILAGSGGYFLAARALAPIDKITHTARKISANDLATRLDLPDTEDEVGRLAATIDSMLARLDAAFQRERQFTADASHELRTPLSAMQTIIGSTLGRPRTRADYEQALTDLGDEVEQMRMLTDGLLHLARNDAARQRGRFEPVDLSILLQDVADSLRPLAEEKGLQLIERIPTTGLNLMGDPDGLVRLFANLIDNAIKYTDQGAITLSAAAQNGDGLQVTIRDTGVGIAPEHLPHIFDRFYRVDESRSTEGIGLGLAIALETARAHGGDIAVESTAASRGEGVGIGMGENAGEHGTTFVVRLAAT
jgi:heavy metal sensor kinase